MGPILLCDKSTLQALGRRELNVLRRYYFLNMPPVLLVEILGDLHKMADSTMSREEVKQLFESKYSCTRSTRISPLPRPQKDLGVIWHHESDIFAALFLVKTQFLQHPLMERPVHVAGIPRLHQWVRPDI